MKKRTKISLVLSSAAAILLAGSIMAGGTYALFTSESKTNIAVTSGTVNVTATISDLKTYSGVNLTGDATTDTISETDEAGKFTNGGTAVYENGTLTLDNVTPGDKVTFKLTVVNHSTVSSKYRTKISKTEDTGLFAGLKFSIGGSSAQALGDWEKLDAADEGGTKIVECDCSVELPSSAGDEYQNKKCTIAFGVEAIQGNAATHTLVEVSNESELRTALYNAPTTGMGVNVVLKNDITLEMLYTAELYNNSKIEGVPLLYDYEEGDTLSHYKVGTTDSEELRSYDGDKKAFGAKYYCHSKMIGRLVVKKNQDVIIDLNGHSLKKADDAHFGDWNIINTDVIANFGKLKVTDSSNSVGTLYGNGFVSCTGAVLHNYVGSTMSVEKIKVDGRASLQSAGTGQYSVVNEGGSIIIDSASIVETPTTVSASLVKNTDNGEITVKGTSELKSTKVVNCKSGKINLLSGTITSTDESKFAVKSEGTGVVEITDSAVTINGELITEDGGKIIHK